MNTDSLYRMEPMMLGSIEPALADLATELSAAGALLGSRLHPRTAGSLAALVRIMNAYYTNLIEGHETRPRDIERALAGQLDAAGRTRDLQLEAISHVKVQAWVDSLAIDGQLPDPSSGSFLRELHRRFYEGAPSSMLRVDGPNGGVRFVPGSWRSAAAHDVTVGSHVPPVSPRVERFMTRFAERYSEVGARPRAGIVHIPAAHHRFGFIHPFVDGNGRVGRLMSHAMAHRTGIGAQGLWSISRGLARGLESRGEYMRWMDHADMPRQGDRDGRGNLSERALHEFSVWFLKICLDQVDFMSGMFDLAGLSARLERWVASDEGSRPEVGALLREALVRGEFERGETARLTGLPERSARRVLHSAIGSGLLASDTPKGPVSLRFPAVTLETLFPRLYPQT